MEEDEIKLDETDSSEENLFGDLFEDEGDTNDTPTSDTLTVAELEELAGRKFTSKEDFTKHYGNLKSFAGKVNQTKETPKEKASAPQAEAMDAVLAEMNQLKTQIAERDFVLDTPEAKGSLNLIRKVAKADGISMSEAWEQVKDIAVSAEEYKKGRDIGVNSKTRINPLASEKNREIVNQAKMGSPEAMDAIVASQLKRMGMM